MQTGSAASDEQAGQQAMEQPRRAGPAPIGFSIPFARRISQGDLRQVNERNITFLRGHGLLRSDEAEQRFLAQRVGELAMLFYPSSNGEGLEIAADAIAWAAFFDDLYEGEGKASAQAAVAITYPFVDITLRRTGIEPGADVHPLVWAFANMWKREAAGMSVAWQKRAAANWRRWMLSFVSEAVHGERRPALSVDEYVPFRRATTGHLPAIDVIEGCMKFELPHGVRECSEFQSFFDIVGDSIGWVNDVYSVHVDEARGHPYNLVLLLQRERSCSRREAIDEVVRMHRARMQRWLELQDHLPHVYRALRLRDVECEVVDRYLRDLAAMIVGNEEWHRHSGRFDLDILRDVHHPAYMEAVPAFAAY